MIRSLLALLTVLILVAGCRKAAAPAIALVEALREPAIVVPSPTPLPISTVPPSPLPEPSATAEPSPSATAEPTPTATAEPTATATVAPTPTATLASERVVNQTLIAARAPVRLVDQARIAAQAPVRLVIPDLKIDAPVVPMGWRVVETANGPVSEWVIPEDEAGHHINSAALGEPGNLVISGHNNIFGRVFEPISRAWSNDTRVAVDRFTDRSEVLNGRQLQLYGSDGLRVDYQIEEFYRLRDTSVPIQQRIENARFMQPTDDSRVTIVTCWPPWNNTHRLVVIARPALAQ
jgi:sortase A